MADCIKEFGSEIERYEEDWNIIQKELQKGLSKKLFREIGGGFFKGKLRLTIGNFSLEEVSETLSSKFGDKRGLLGNVPFSLLADVQTEED